MAIFLSEDPGKPLYRQVRSGIERAVSAGMYRDSPLPSSRALAAELGVSRTTVNLAYQELVAEGFIFALPRSGFRVNAELIARLGQAHSVGPSRAEPEDYPAIDWSLELRIRSSNFPEIAKDPDWASYKYPFVYGQVSSQSFPAAAWNRALRDALDGPNIGYCLRDAGSEDDPMLIDQLCRSVLPQRGIRARPDQVLVTHGTQHGLFLASRILARSDDVVVVENPGYPDAAHIFRREGARIAPVPVDGSGLVMPDMPNDARLIYTTPSHQFPTNVSLSVARRGQLFDYCTAVGAFVIEDDYDSEFRYVGRPAPALRSTDDPRVVYLGSFSKFLAPGLRLGYVVAAPEVIAAMRLDRRYSLRHAPGHIQRAMALLIASGDYHRSLRRNRSVLRRKWRVITSSVRAHLGWSFGTPTGGASLWVRLPDRIDADRLTAAAAALGIFVESGSTYFLDRSPTGQYIRLGFAAIPEARLDPGIRALRQVAHSL